MNGGLKEHQTSPFRSAKPFLRKHIKLEELHSLVRAIATPRRFVASALDLICWTELHAPSLCGAYPGLVIKQTRNSQSQRLHVTCAYE
jgi:hypothetical protein